VFLIVSGGLMDHFYTAATACRMESFSGLNSVRNDTIYVVAAIG